MRFARKLAWVLLVAMLFGATVAQAGGKLRPYYMLPRAASSVELPWSVANLAKAYNFPKKALPGGGVIGILELGGGYTQTDLDRFSVANGLPRIPVTSISVNGGQNLPNRSDDDIEVLLDIEVSAAVYYYTTGKMPTIKVFFAPNDFGSFTAVVNAAVANQCDVLSISWGAPEVNWTTFGPPNALQDLDTAVAAANAKGLAVFAASGDNSSSDGGSGNNVDGPASCPHIVACGGTNKTGAAETVWGTAGDPTAEGTGGGFSTVFAKQSFQVGAPRGTGRLVPDVAADADPNTGYNIVCFSQPIVVGGTSAVSPLYSGLFASFGKKLGNVSPKLWQNKGAFFDIKVGSNGGFSALPGADACTGLGAPNGTLLYNAFKTTSSVVHFQVAAVGANVPTSKISLPVSGLEFSSQDVFTNVSGASPDLPSAYAGLVIDLSSLFGTSSQPSIFGVGGGLQPYFFTGSK